MSYEDITPDTSIVLSWANQLHHWPTILGELIDNAFDADASRVEITIAKDRLSIEDNGMGCADLRHMLTAGKNVKHPTTRLGRYGIGFKQAVSSAGGAVQISSIHQGQLRYAAINWDDLAQSNRWQADFQDPVQSDTHSGTRISISRLRSKSGISRSSIETIKRALSEQYSPAMKQGRQLVLHAHGRQSILTPPTRPELEYMRRVELLVGRKKAELEIGIVPETASYAPSALTVSYSFRVIQRGVRWGLGTEPTPGLVGWLELLDGWNLSTNKEKVLDEDLEALEKQIAERCADIIARAVHRGYSIPVDGANALLAGMLQSMQSKKARRKSPQNPTGTVTPKLTPRRHRKAAQVQPGNTFLHHREATGIKLSLAKKGIEGGLFNCQEGGIVELNVDNPEIAAMRMNQRSLACIALLGLAANAVILPNGQLPLLLHEALDGNAVEQISQLANNMLRNLPAIDDSEVLVERDAYA